MAYSSTPSEIQTIIIGRNNRHMYEQQLEFMRVGTLIATNINLQRTKKSDKTWKWQDIFPPTIDAFKPAKQSINVMKCICRDFTLAMGGKVSKRGRS